MAISKQKFYEKLVTSDNIADIVDEDKLLSIGTRVLSDYEYDLQSMKGWLDVAKSSIDLAKMEPEEKNFPFEKASNVKYPIITRAVLQFTANVSSEIVRKDKAVGITIIGEDPDGQKQMKAKNTADYMNYQLLFKRSSTWVKTMDRTLSLLATVGSVLHKVWFDPVSGLEKIDLIPYDKLVINNQAKSLEAARRVSHKMEMHKTIS